MNIYRKKNCEKMSFVLFIFLFVSSCCLSSSVTPIDINSSAANPLLDSVVAPISRTESEICEIFRDKSFTVENVNLFLSECGQKYYEEINAVRGKDVILFFGLTGQGKSSLINYLTNKTLKWAPGGRLEVEYPNDSQTFVIGDGSSSCTLFPRTEQYGEYLFCDLPGLNDNRGELIEFFNINSIRTIIKNAKSIKVVTVLKWGMFEDIGRGSTVRTFLEDLQKIITQKMIDDHSCLIVTQTDKETTEDINELNTELHRKARDITAVWRNSERIAQMFKPRRSYPYDVSTRDEILEVIGRVPFFSIAPNPITVLPDPDIIPIPPIPYPPDIETIINEILKAKAKKICEDLILDHSEDPAIDVQDIQGMGALNLEKFYLRNRFKRDVRNKFRKNKDARIFKELAQLEYERFEIKINEVINPFSLERMTAIENGNITARYDTLEKILAELVETEENKFRNTSIPLRKLAQRHLDGISIEKDLNEAVKYFRLAAAQFDVISLRRLGEMYENSQGVTKNISKAFDFYDLASKKNDDIDLHKLFEKSRYKKLRILDFSHQEDATFRLALLYLTGIGVNIDFDKVYSLFAGIQERNVDASRMMKIPIIARRGYEIDYLTFIKSALIYDNGKEHPQQEMLIESLSIPHGSNFDLSNCEDMSTYLQVSTGYRKEVNINNLKKTEIWIVPNFVLNCVFGRYDHLITRGTKKHGIFFTSGGWSNMDFYDYYLFDGILDKDLYTCSKISKTNTYEKITRRTKCVEYKYSEVEETIREPYLAGGSFAGFNYTKYTRTECEPVTYYKEEEIDMKPNYNVSYNKNKVNTLSKFRFKSFEGEDELISLLKFLVNKGKGLLGVQQKNPQKCYF